MRVKSGTRRLFCDYAAFVFAVVLVWVLSALVLNWIVQPLHLDHDGNMVFDLVALLEAAAIVTALAALSWFPIFAIALRFRVHARFVAPFATFAILMIAFELIENYADLSINCRPCEVLAEGRDIAFVPFIIPLVSIASSLVFILMLWLVSTPKGASADQEPTFK